MRITQRHFRELYNAERIKFDVYESARVGQLRNFALSDALQILVINIDAFAKDADPSSGQKFKGNVINQLRESGIRPIQFIQETCPVVILDEPQNLETDKRKQAIARLNPMCTLRYSGHAPKSVQPGSSSGPVRGLVRRAWSNRSASIQWSTSRA